MISSIKVFSLCVAVVKKAGAKWNLGRWQIWKLMDERVEKIDFSRMRALRKEVSEGDVLSLRPQEIMIVLTWSGIVHWLRMLAKFMSFAPLYATVCQSFGTCSESLTPFDAVRSIVLQSVCISGNCHASLFHDAKSDRCVLAERGEF